MNSAGLEDVQGAATARRQLVVQIALSLAILFQLFCAVLAPNQNVYIRARLAPLMDRYVNVLGLSATWSFFAPEPGPPPIFIEYERYDENGKTLEKNSWPERGASFWFYDRALRRGAVAPFILGHPDFAAPTLISYLCHANPGTHSIRLWSVVAKFPKMSDVAEGKQPVGSDAEGERKAMTFEFCEAGK